MARHRLDLLSCMDARLQWGRQMIRLSLEEVVEGLERHSFIFEDEQQHSLIVFILTCIYAHASQGTGGQPNHWNG